MTEGEDKPPQYPHTFKVAALMVLNTIYLLPDVDFDASRCIGHARRINPGIQSLQLSATAGQAIETWCDWLRRHVGTDALAEPAL